MPELPEVERATKLVSAVATNRRIERVETVEDVIVFSDVTHTDFAKELVGRTVLGAKRYGKVFYIELDGSGKLPVLHFGMTGMLQVKGELPTYYKSTPKNQTANWPPRFFKFILHLSDPSSGMKSELAFLDARRLGRIRLCQSPMTEPPISQLGFDPILTMPDVGKFIDMVKRRMCPIKSLLLDQSFSAGVGNWVADEILYNAHVHPEQRCNTLSSDQLASLHKRMVEVCQIAVEANADDSKFPDHWLFKHRWGKGKNPKKNPNTLTLPSGEPATIKWLTVGGRTSAYVAEVQVLPRSVDHSNNNPDPEDSLSDLTPPSDSETIPDKKRKVEEIDSISTPGSKRQKKAKLSTLVGSSTGDQDARTNLSKNGVRKAKT